VISSGDINSILADVDVVADGTGPVVALAHGAGGGVRENFSPIIAALAGQRRLVGPYYPGAGGTPLAAAPLAIEDLADQVVAAGVRAGGDRFPVVGLSLGAAVATTAAARHPEHVSALILTVGLVRPDAQSRAFVTAWRALAAAGDLDALAALLLHSSGTAADLAALPEESYNTAVKEIRETYPPGGASQAELVLRTDVTPLLPRISVPTLVVIGGLDRVVLPETVRRYGQIPGSTVLEYSDAGHIFGPTQTRRWVADVRRFLDTVSPAV
jgi:pimeloyl-ACP methyl ester carboxylesterase